MDPVTILGILKSAFDVTKNYVIMPWYNEIQALSMQWQIERDEAKKRHIERRVQEIYEEFQNLNIELSNREREHTNIALGSGATIAGAVLAAILIFS
jgi:predicted sugar kinase